MRYYPGENWYAIRVRSRFENIARKSLADKEVPSLNLTYQVLSRRKDRKKILTKSFFPGYMFIKSILTAEKHVEILNSTGVIEVLKNSHGPLPIPQEQIDNVRKLEKYEGKITTFEEFVSGMLVKVVQGPLKGIQGYVDEIQRDLIKIGIESIPGTVAIQVSPCQIQPVHSSGRFIPV